MDTLGDHRNFYLMFIRPFTLWFQGIERRIVHRYLIRNRFQLAKWTDRINGEKSIQEYLDEKTKIEKGGPERHEETRAPEAR